MADKRADQLKEITERLEQGVKDIFTSEMYTKYLLTMSKFHNYSFNNTLLIAMQRQMLRWWLGTMPGKISLTAM